VRVAIVHDVLVQPAGGERVVLAMAKAFPGAPIYTSIYDHEGAFDEFRSLDVKSSPIGRIPAFRRHYRWAFPLMAWSFSRMRIDADVILCSSAGWAHGVPVRPGAAKVVYCHTPARWLYQTDRYIGDGKLAWRVGLRAMRRRLIAWDKSAAATATKYIANSRAVRDRIRECYGIEAVTIPPPANLDPEGPADRVAGIEPGYILCVSRLLPYKNVGALIEAFRGSDAGRLVVVGGGPEEQRLRESAPANVTLVGSVSDNALRWLYRHCAGIAAASYEDFGLSVVEGAAFGKPAAALKWGGFLDSVVEGVTGVFFDEPRPAAIAGAIRQMQGEHWDADAIRRHTVEQFGEPRFIDKIKQLVDEELDHARKAS
jgi:glycosyltransferase involved in cell wall biosynthesis